MQPEIISTSSSVDIFAVGDKVIYPGHGVGEIKNIVTRSVAGQDISFFEIELIDGKGTKIMVPESRTKEVGLRHPVSKDSLTEVYAILKQKNCKVEVTTWNRRYRDYSQKLRSGSLLDIAEVLRDLNVIKSGKELSFGEKKMLESAKALLASEIAVVHRRTEENVIVEIDTILVH